MSSYLSRELPQALCACGVVPPEQAEAVRAAILSWERDRLLEVWTLEDVIDQGPARIAS